MYYILRHNYTKREYQPPQEYTAVWGENKPNAIKNVTESYALLPQTPHLDLQAISFVLKYHDRL